MTQEIEKTTCSAASEGGFEVDRASPPRGTPFSGGSGSLSERASALRAIFPDDERLRNAILMTMGCSEQIPPLNDALKSVLFDLPKSGDSTVQWENLTHLAVADVLQWSARIEIALHDLRQSLFFRYNNRVRKMDVPTEEQHQKIEEAVSEEVKTSEVEEKAAESAETKKTASKKIASLFGDIGKKK